MTTPILHPDWRNQVQSTDYPFADGVKIEVREGFSLAPEVFLDASFYLPGGTSPLYLSEISVGPETATWVVRAGTAIATGTSNILDPEELIEFLDDYGRSVGFLLVDPIQLAALRTWNPGTYVFLTAAKEFATETFVPLPSSGLRGLLLDSGELFAGDVWLVGERGVVLRLVEQSRLPACTDLGSSDAPSRDAIRIDVVGDPLFRRRLCDEEALTGVEDTLFTTPRFIRQIRFKQDEVEFVVTPDEFGGIVLASSRLVQELRGALRVHTSEGRIVVELANAG
jgi:hypothetical protein